MEWAISTVCKKGGRDYNQDYLAAAVDTNSACFVVCDGLGSYVGSEVASNLSSGQVIRSYKELLIQKGNLYSTNQVSNTTSEDSDSTVDSTAPIQNLFTDEFVLATIQKAHEYVATYKEQNPIIASSCTTLACVFSENDKMVIAHIGDTRVYVVRQGKIDFQTKDHSLAQVAVDKGEINSHEIRQHKDQNKLTRVLGSDYFVAPDIKILDTPLEKGDGFMLCTDGWWEYVYEDEIEAIFKLTNNPQDALQRMERRLTKRAPQYNDNFSAIIAMIQ